ncbi:Proteophosphoglycan 5 [Rhodotorula toruloides ATCC 204091]|uniref:Proteophosphoglycan 5 n=1 Tax=Rhodotorula toruloides TaxID=5286 RepID=A0A0K3CP37_RHOTO|nr:Proteophosphoglycan 5 [Rhodotorula toruloides ATCC 204091]PRQ71502.1 Proteophosphoglycan 5 [Rhodotorula toruloides]
MQHGMQDVETGFTPPSLDYHSLAQTPSLDEQKYRSNVPSAPPKPKGIARTLFIVIVGGLALALAQLAIPAVLVAYIFVVHNGSISLANRTVYTTAPLGRVTAIANFLETVVSHTAAPAMALFGYLVAARWLRSSVKKDSKSLMTPVQRVLYALEMKLLNSANLNSIFRAYHLRMKLNSSTRRFRKNGVALPRSVKRTLGLLVWLTFWRYVVAAINTAFQATAIAGLVPDRLSPGLTTADFTVGRALNQTRCDVASASASRLAADSCGLENGSNNGMFLYMPQAERVLSNSSSVNSVAWLDDNTAILTDPTLPDMRFTASSPSIWSDCRTETAWCLCEGNGNPVYDGVNAQTCDVGPEAWLALDCAPSVRFNATALLNQVESGTGGSFPAASLLTANGSLTFTPEVDPTTRTASLGIILATPTYSDGVDDDNWAGSTGFFRHGHSGSWNVLVCDLWASTVVYSYSPSTGFSYMSRQPASLDLAKYLTYHADVGIQAVAQLAEGAGLGNSSASYVDVFGRHLSKSVLSMASVLMTPTAPISVSGGDVLGTGLNLPLFLTYLATSVVSALTILFMTVFIVAACLGTPRDLRPFVKPVQARLTDSTFLANWLYGKCTTNPKRIYSDEALDLFEPEQESERLAMEPRVDSYGWSLRPARL